MSVIYGSALRTARMNAVKDAIDAGGGANGTIEIGTTAMALTLATIALAKPCGSVSGDILTFTMPKSDTSADAGAPDTAAAARIKDCDGNVVVSGLTVGTVGTNIVLDAATITAGQTITLTAATITHNTTG